MTYKNALKVNIGDTLLAKDGYKFVVEKITEESNAANTEKYIRFTGKCNSGFQVFYLHKQII
jgi:hypothetical protein